MPSDNPLRMKSLTLITISFNSFERIRANHHQLLSDPEFDSILIDNCSRDDSCAQLESTYPNSSVIGLPENVGYGRGANEALRRCKTRYALLLNPDLQAPKAEILQLLSIAQEDSEAATWGPAVSAQTHQPGATAEDREVISGCAMLFDMQRMEKVGYFDENIFLFYEENDLCKRIRDHHFKVRYCPTVCFEHEEGTSTRGSDAIEFVRAWHFAWSKNYYHTKHGIAQGKHDAKRVYRQYQRKFWFALNPLQRLRYRAKAQGAKAFLDGESSFTSSGRAQFAP